MIAALLLAFASGQATPPVPANSPADWFPPDVYPAEAIRLRQEGAVRFRLSIDAGGAITGCDVVEGSGSAILDRETCALAIARGRYKPARDDRGRAVAGTDTQRVRWAIPESEPLAWKDREEVSALTIAPGDKVVRCTVQEDDGPVRDCSTDVPPAAATMMQGGGAETVIATTVLRIAIAPAADEKGPQPPAGGTMLSLSRVTATITADGRVADCLVTATDGPWGGAPVCRMIADRRFEAASDAAPRSIVATNLLYRTPAPAAPPVTGTENAVPSPSHSRP